MSDDPKTHEPGRRYPSTPRSRLRRHPERGSADRDEVRSVLAATSLGHVAFVEAGRPVVIPMGYGLLGDELLLHGSHESRLMQAVADGRPVCVSVAVVDGLVLARSAFHSSMNYRSAVVFGRGRALEKREEKRRALEALVEHLAPGRGALARPTTDEEVDGTLVVAIVIEEASAKVRTGPPREPERDLAYPVWAGVIPMWTAYGQPEPAPDLTADYPLPVLPAPVEPAASNRSALSGARP